MCISMFKSSANYVYINRLAHNLRKLSVAKKVTLPQYAHIHNTATPQSGFVRAQTVKVCPVSYILNTLYTGITTTIFKLVTEQTVEQKNSSLTINFKTLYN